MPSTELSTMASGLIALTACGAPWLRAQTGVASTAPVLGKADQGPELGFPLDLTFLTICQQRYQDLNRRAQAASAVPIALSFLGTVRLESIQRLEDAQREWTAGLRLGPLPGADDAGLLGNPR